MVEEKLRKWLYWQPHFPSPLYLVSFLHFSMRKFFSFSDVSRPVGGPLSRILILHRLMTGLMKGLFARCPILPLRGRRDSTETGLSLSELFYSGTGTKSGSAVYTPSRPEVMLIIQALEEETGELWARTKRSLWQEDPVLQKTMKGNYNYSSHQTFFISFLPGKSVKAFQSLQNETGHNPSHLLSSSGLNGFHLWMRQIRGNGTSEPQGWQSFESQLCPV